MVSIIDGVFWGAALIVVGVWFIVRRYVPVHIPVIRIIIAVFFVYIGIRVLVGVPSIRDRNTVVFSDSNLRYQPGEERDDYNIIFGNGNVDFTDFTTADGSLRAQVNVVFGNGTLRINPEAPVRVRMSSAFGTVEAPNGRSVAFGESVYSTPAYRENAPALEIRASAVFGRLRIAP